MNKAQHDWVEGRRLLSLHSVISVKAKIASGEYPLEHVPCFCGADNDEEIITHEREGIPHRIVVCRSCAIARATPRMTAEAYKSYYNNEYRDLTYRWIRSSRPTNLEEYNEAIVKIEQAQGDHLLKLLVNETIDMPKKMLDIGCYKGGMLDVFKARGVETWGLDYNEMASGQMNERGHVTVSSLDVLIEAGEKFDFICMQDVIEHFTDLKDMLKVRDLLTEEGTLYIYTPGLFRTDPKDYWQLAHTYYFVGSTLQWMMESLGFKATYVDEDVTSFWHRADKVPEALLPNPPAEWADYIRDEALGKEDRKLPPFRGICKFTKKLLYDNMLRNFAKSVPDIHAVTQTQTGAAIIVSGGPSIDGREEQIKELQAQGGKVFSIARMYPWCVDHGITPDYVVSLDCSEEQEKGFTHIQKDTTHLMATVSRPEILQMILDAGAKVYIFDARDDRKIKQLRRDAGYEVCTVINSGGTVALTCISCAFNIGFTELHIFGFDCMFPNSDKFHAEGIAGESVEQRPLSATIEGVSYLTTSSMIEFARQALDLFSVAHDEGILTNMKVYGESLITKMWDGEWHEDE